jgi:thiol-disulfide isomerase/thioredoxin
MRLLSCLLLSALAGVAPAASVAEVLEAVDQNLTPEELQEPGSQARAKAIAEMLKGDLGLSASDLADLKLALAEAWLDAQKPDEADAVVAEVLGGTVTPTQRERGGLALVASWQLRFKQAPDPTKLAPPADALKKYGDLGARVASRVCSAEAQRLLAQTGKDGKPQEPEKIFAQYDQALALLKDAPAEERVPVYHLRLLAMEAAQLKPEVIQAWLQERQSDPAAAEVADSAMTAGQKLVGQPAPPLKMKPVGALDRVKLKDGTVLSVKVVETKPDGSVVFSIPGGADQAVIPPDKIDKVEKGDATTEVDIASFKGKPVLVSFFASWHKPSAAVAPAIAAFAAKHEAELATIGVTLDTKDTIGDVAAFVLAYGIGYPVIGDGLGWDSDVDDAWHVDKIPTLILVGADGRVASTDLIGATDEETIKNLDAALAGLTGKKPDGGGAKPAGGDEPP